MKKSLLLILILAVQILALPTTVQAAGSSTQTFKLIVTIPAIVGLNVPDPNAETKDPLAISNIVSNTITDIVFSDRIVDRQRITYRTLVVR